MEKIELFVPGRLCLFGEHSDWAGLHRVINSAIVPGQAIVTGIEQGIYAEVEKHEKFIVQSNLPSYHDASFSCEMDSEKLREEASAGGFFSYVAGVASYVNECYNVGGLKITITRMDLPMKSGLSSSAAICVLVARAFNQMYRLKLNTMGEMNIAFIGEQRTPSRCGRLDQACAYGVRPVRMTFDGNEVSAKPLSFKNTLYWVIADLKSHKDTVQILSDLNKCYPFAQNEKERAVHEALGCDNKEFVDRACEHLAQGDNEALGKLMIDFQRNFDRKVAPASYEELKAPVLHSVLEDANVKELVYGAKGVGSQGDGTVQFLARDEECQKKLIDYLNNKLGMEAFSLTLRPQQAVTKAVIPVAGFGTRLYPATKGIKKDFFPILDEDGLFKPAIMVLLEQLDASGIEEICLVIGEEEKPMYDTLFAPLSEEHRSKLPAEKRFYEDKILRIGKKITYVYQKERRGFGHAVYQCREFTKGQPVLLLLGDMIYESYGPKSCMSQLIDAYEKTGLPIVSMHAVPLSDVVHYGIMHGQWENKEETLLKLDAFCEKPSCEYADEFLGTVRKNARDQYFAVFGQYILTKEVFEVLENDIRENRTSGGEIQLTTALDKVRERIGMMGLLMNGKSYDIGLPGKYKQTLTEFGKGKEREN